MCVHNVDNQEVHSPDLPFKVLAKPCKRERKLLQTSPEKTESCALDCTLSPDTLVKAFVQMIANTSSQRLRSRFARHLEQVKAELSAMQENILKLKLRRKLR